MQIQNFDATAIPPQQGAGAHPPGTFPFIVGNTYGQETKGKDGGMLVVQFTTQMGQILNYYNLFNKSEQAVEIARKELSALSHATGVFKLSFLDPAGNVLPMDQWARELRNARGVIEIGPQVGNEKFMEVKKVFDAAGNEPGKGPSPAPQPQQAQGSGWGAPGNAAQPPQQPQGGGWSAGATQQPAANPPAQGGWQPGPQGGAPAGGAPPPWAGGSQK